jgi:hypothetical protein
MRVFMSGREWTKLPVHTLVYEDLVADPEGTLRPVTEFLGLEWKPELLDHRTTAAKQSAIKTPSYDSVTQALTKRPSGRWRRYKSQLEPVLPVLLPWRNSWATAASDRNRTTFVARVRIRTPSAPVEWANCGKFHQQAAVFFACPC